MFAGTGVADSAAGCRRRSRRTGPPATSTSAWRTTCARRSRSGRIAAVPNAGGYPGSPYFKITIAGTDRAWPPPRTRELVVAARLHRRARTTLAHRAAYRRRLAHHAQVGSEFERAAGALGDRQQFRDAREVRSQERQTALAVENAMRRPLMNSPQRCTRVARWSDRRALPSPPRLAAAHADASRVAPEKAPDADGFIQRWLLLEPIACQRAHRQRRAGSREEGVFPQSVHVVPRDGDKVTVGDTELTWHAVDTKAIQRQPLSLRPRAGQADLQCPVLGGHHRQLPARRCPACAWPSAPTRLRSGG